MLPLSQRVLYSNSACEVEHKPLNVLPSRQGRDKAWDSEKLERAVKAVCCDGATIYNKLPKLMVSRRVRLMTELVERYLVVVQIQGT